MSNFVKDPSTFEQQINKLETRGCIIGDYQHAKLILQQINYYKLTSYFLPFKNKDDTYKENTTLNNVFRTYKFDSKLRKLLFSVIEEIELMLRTQISYFFAHKYGAIGYLSRSNFNNLHKHDEFLKRVEILIERNKRQLFVKHHLEKRNGQFPIWVIIELFSLSDISKFYSDMQIKDQKQLARELFRAIPSEIRSWLRCLTELRNYCAHYSRIYYYNFPSKPTTPKNINFYLNDKAFGYVAVLKFLYYEKDKWNTIIVPKIKALIEQYEGSINLLHIGFPQKWENFLINSRAT